jgi:DNA-binding CsgD family transcriptional regulator
VRLLQHRRDEAITEFRRAVKVLDAFGLRAPLMSGARLRLAEALAEAGERDEAAALADAAVEDARRAGTSGALGAALRVRARTGSDPVPALDEAVATLAKSPLRLEHARALHDLGAALRRAGRPGDARAPLRAALDRAQQAEAARLERLAREELAASGARPRRTALRGVDALTPSERRVADLVASGLTNREVAEALWVTRKTVEVHLARVYEKLGVKGRTELPAVLIPTGP